MLEEIRNIKSGKKELRKFGITLGLALALWGGLFLWHEKKWSTYFFVFSPLFIILAVVFPVVLKPLHKTLTILFLFISSVVTWFVLFVLFYGVIAPSRFLARLCGKEFLDLKYNGEADSYWIPRKTTCFKKENYERQF